MLIMDGARFLRQMKGSADTSRMRNFDTFTAPRTEQDMQPTGGGEHAKHKAESSREVPVRLRELVTAL